MLIAILGGLGAAILWAISNLSSSRSTRMIGATSALAWVMVVGLILDGAAILVTRAPAPDPVATLPWLAIAGFGNAFGLLLLMSALRVGKVGLATSITSTEGAVAALYSVLAGEKLPTAAFLFLPIIVIGVVLATLAKEEHAIPGERKTLAAGLAVAAALMSGASIYATGHVSDTVALPWLLLPPRLVGVVLIAVPIALAGRLRLTRAATPLVILTGVVELLGWLSFAIGSKGSIAIAAVLSSLFAATATVGAYFLFKERLGRAQLAGVCTIVVGVTALTAVLH